MSENDAPSEPTSGDGPAQRPTDAVLSALPAKVRVHALARLVGSSSREVLALLARLDVGARSAQSSVDRETVARVVDEYFPSAPVPAAEVVPPLGAGDEPEPGAPADALTELDPAAGEGSPAAAPSEVAAPQPVSGAPTAAPTAPAAPAPMFLAPDTAAPDAEAAKPRRRRGSRSAGVVTPGADPQTTTTGAPAEAEPTPTSGSATSGSPTSGSATSGSPTSGPVAPAPTTSTDDGDDTGSDVDEDAADGTGTDDDTDDDGGRRRRRRGRRGRGRGKGPAEDGSGDDSDDDTDTDASGTAAADATESAGEDEGTEESAEGGEDTDDSGADETSWGSRRRRRRRRRGSDGDGDDAAEDPPNTVVHVREKANDRERRAADEEVRGVKGSTRLEAKRQRRRDGREAGRRRPPILSESEFLARRESVDRTMVVRQQSDRSQIGVLEDGVLVEHFVAGHGQNSMVGNVYLGRVQNVLPSMEAAFVDIGRGRNAVLYAGEVNWDASGLEGKQRKIEQALSSGDSVLVQVTKDPVGHKGARLTTQISLPGRFLVYVPGGGATGISRKLPDNERKRLKDILKRIVPDESGVIIRTAAEGVSEDELERDVRRLKAQWEVIERTGRSSSEGGGGKTKAPSLVHEEPDLLIRVVRDMFNEDFSSLVISGEQAWETIHGYISHVAPELAPRLQRHTGPEDVFTAYRIDEQLLKALDRKVWLPSGGTLVIDRTEAMTVIDVNTGKFTGSGGNLEETVTRNNLEAAEEVVRQLRLRDIGGMIVIDFIDMVLESNRDLVLRRLTECLGRDRTRHQVAEVTSLGLVQMTRKRVGQGLLDEFSTPCEHCKGRGVIVHTEPVIEAGSGSSGSSGRGRGGGGGDQAAASGNGAAGGNGSGNGPSTGSGNGSGQGSADVAAATSGNGSSPKEVAGSGGGRRRGRGRRSASSEGGSPATVSGSATARDDDASGDGVDESVPGTEAGTDTGAGTAGAAVEETEVALGAGPAEESDGTADATPADATATDAPDATATKATRAGDAAPETAEVAAGAAESPEVALEAEVADASAGESGSTDAGAPDDGTTDDGTMDAGTTDDGTAATGADAPEAGVVTEGVPAGATEATADEVALETDLAEHSPGTVPDGNAAPGSAPTTGRRRSRGSGSNGSGSNGSRRRGAGSNGSAAATADAPTAPTADAPTAAGGAGSGGSARQDADAEASVAPSATAPESAAGAAGPGAVDTSAAPTVTGRIGAPGAGAGLTTPAGPAEDPTATEAESEGTSTPVTPTPAAPRRRRRTASRPAGPPVAGEAADGNGGSANGGPDRSDATVAAGATGTGGN